MFQGQSWALEDLESHLQELVQEHYSIVTHNGKNNISMLCHNCSSISDTVYLRDKEHGSPTHSGVDRSHLPSDLSSDITSDKKSHANAPGSFANPQHIIDSHIVSDELGVTDKSSFHTRGLIPDRTAMAPDEQQLLANARSSSG